MLVINKLIKRYFLEIYPKHYILVHKKRIQNTFAGKHNQQNLYVVSIRNDSGMSLCITNFGATLMSLDVPDINGKPVNVVVGFTSVQEYIDKTKVDTPMYIGASIGRYAGRISKEKISINAKNYPLYHHKGVHLHGGKYGFDQQIWQIDSIDEDEMKIVLSYLSRDMEEGYPGNLKAKVTYQLTKNNELIITYHAVSDQDTVVNLTNHAYYNLNGEGTITDHFLKVNASFYLEVDKNQLPTGILKPISNTKFDFTSSKKLDIIQNKGLIDDTFVVNEHHFKIAKLTSPKTGIKMTVKSNQPSVVIYTPERFPNWEFVNNSSYSRFPAICFETQNYPDAPNHKNFPSSYLKAGEQYENRSIFKFTTI